MRSGKTVYTVITVLADKLRLAAVTVFAHEIALTRTIVVAQILEVDLTLGAVRTLGRRVLARIRPLAVRTEVTVCALAFVVLRRLKRAHTFMLARPLRAHVEYLALCAAVIVRTFARVVEFIRELRACATVKTSRIH